jgi:[acyl-carrier-protein] S-malonyltransferase
MATNTYILCPGQGAQHVGMGRDFFEKSPEAKAIFDRADAALGYAISQLCFEGPEDRLNQTDASQPAIFATSVACHAAAKAAGKLGDGPFVYAGLSLGEYTALHLAGVFTFEEGLRLVAARGRLMQAAAVGTPSSMVAIMGASEAEIDTLCANNAAGEVLVPANYNAAGQIVVSGTKAACERINAAAGAAGFRSIPLVVAGAFHSPVMQPAADRMAEELEQATLRDPVEPVYANVTAERHGNAESIKRLLVEQIVKPVRWEQTMRQVASETEARFVELAPGKVLTGLLKKANRRANVLTLSAADALS